MDRLTFLDNGGPAFRFKGCVYKIDIAQRLYAYEETGLTPAEIEALKRDNVRLHKLLDDVESIVKYQNGG